MIAEAERLLQTSLAGGSALALPFALFGGLAVPLNPCCLFLYPAAAATCCVAAKCDARPRLAFGNAIAFVLGTAIATTTLGIGAAMLGRTMTSVGGDWLRCAAALPPARKPSRSLQFHQLAPRLLLQASACQFPKTPISSRHD